MDQHTHKLPDHLGGWPCTIVGSMFKLDDREHVFVAYQFGNSGQGRMPIALTDLTRILPAEPDAPCVVGADGIVYVRLGGHEPGTGERLWVDITSIRGTRPWTWGALTIAWEEENKQQRIIPLAPDPLTNAPELPCRLPTGIEVDISERGSLDPEPIKLELGDGWAWLCADDAEQAGLALLRAVAVVRKTEDL